MQASGSSEPLRFSQQECLQSPRTVASAALDRLVKQSRAAGQNPLDAVRESSGWGFPEFLMSTFPWNSKASKTLVKLQLLNSRIVIGLAC